MKGHFEDYQYSFFFVALQRALTLPVFVCLRKIGQAKIDKHWKMFEQVRNILTHVKTELTKEVEYVNKNVRLK